MKSPHLALTRALWRLPRLTCGDSAQKSVEPMVDELWEHPKDTTPTQPRGIHETGLLVSMKPSIGGGDESTDSNAAPKTTTDDPRGRQFRGCSKLAEPI